MRDIGLRAPTHGGRPRPQQPTYRRASRPFAGRSRRPTPVARSIDHSRRSTLFREPSVTVALPVLCSRWASIASGTPTLASRQRCHRSGSTTWHSSTAIRLRESSSCRRGALVVRRPAFEAPSPNARTTEPWARRSTASSGRAALERERFVRGRKARRTRDLDSEGATGEWTGLRFGWRSSKSSREARRGRRAAAGRTAVSRVPRQRIRARSALQAAMVQSSWGAGLAERRAALRQSSESSTVRVTERLSGSTMRDTTAGPVEPRDAR